MKDYKRLTKWSELGTLHILDFVGKEIPLCDISPIDRDNLAGRFAELEDKIEKGELISTVQDEQSEQETVFFLKHDVEVCEEVVKECLQVLRDIRIACIYDEYSWGWDSGIDRAIEQLAKRYDIDVEDEE